MSVPLYLFLIQLNDEWVMTTRDGSVCAARLEELLPGSPAIRADHPRKTVPVVDLMAPHRDLRPVGPRPEVTA